MATCFDPIGSSSDLHYEPVNVKRLRASFGFQLSIGHEPFTFILCKHYWDAKDVRSILTLIGS
jgi:hypothetical protein